MRQTEADRVGRGVQGVPASGPVDRGARGVGASRPIDRAQYERRFSLWAALSSGVWLVFLFPTLIEATTRQSPTGPAAILTLALFSVVYLVFFWFWRSHPSRAASRRNRVTLLSLIGVLVLLGAVLTWLLGSWGTSTVVYIGVCLVFAIRSLRVALGTCLALGILTEVTVHLIPGWDGASGIGLSVALAGSAVLGFRNLMERNSELLDAREELARLAVEQERDRFARDLHDLLGHSLTVLTVKAELAGRLLERGDAAAGAKAKDEIADIERIARDALADVRSTAAGYREMSLPAELVRARTALSAADIDAQLPGSTEVVPSSLRPLFAWAVREGVTNVVRHSGARHCVIDLDPRSLRIADDGRGRRDGDLRVGTGLEGLSRRASGYGAHVVSRSPATGGHVLTVELTSGEHA